MRSALLPLVAATLLMGCGKHPPKLGKLKDLLPKATFEQFKIKDVSFEGLETTFIFNVENPYPLGLELQALNWKLGLAGNDFLNGANDKGLDIDPGATSAVRIPISLKFADVFNIAKDAKGAGEVPWTIDGDFAFATPIGPITLPFKEQGVMPALSAPKVSLKALRVGKLDLKSQTASLELDLGFESDSDKPVKFSAFGYGIKLDGTDVASGNAKMDTVDGSGMTLPFDIKLVNLGATIIEAITKKTELKVRLNADTEVDTPLGAVPLKINEVVKLQLK